MSESSSLPIYYIARTDTGLQREHNEDCHLIAPDIDLIAVADGMGGYNAGEVASESALTVVATWLSAMDATDVVDQRHQYLHEACDAANQAIYIAACNNSELAGMGTTLVIAWLGNGYVDIANIGDSRAYLIRSDELLQLTCDHTLVQEQLDAGFLDAESARNVAHRNIITRAVGPSLQVTADVTRHDMQPGDKLLLCSDGINEEMDQATLRDLVVQEKSPEQICDDIIQLALQNGGHDNMTVVMACPILDK